MKGRTDSKARASPAPSLKGGDPLSASKFSVGSAVAAITASQWALIIPMIYGGCCINVYSLESIISERPKAGTLLTFCQFVFVSIEGFFHFFVPRYPFVRKPRIPLQRWILPVLTFVSTSVLSNYVWQYNISVPVHIIFRSSGTLFTMIFGWWAGKRYTNIQIASVVLLTLGVAVATVYNNPKEQVSVLPELRSADQQSRFFFGIFLLLLAGVIGAAQGLFQEQTYKIYGKHWRETLFYTHLFSLPFFIFFKDTIYEEFNALGQLSKVSLSLGPLGGLIVSKQVLNLMFNIVTQYICVRGVNYLAGNATALTVTIVLNTRKVASLILSVYLFDNDLTPGTTLGTFMVFIAVFMYAMK